MISNKSNQHHINEILEGFAAAGLSQLKESLERLYNQLMVAEREDYVNAAPYRSEETRLNSSHQPVSRMPSSA